MAKRQRVVTFSGLSSNFTSITEIHAFAQKHAASFAAVPNRQDPLNGDDLMMEGTASDQIRVPVLAPWSAPNSGVQNATPPQTSLKAYMHDCADLTQASLSVAASQLSSPFKASPSKKNTISAAAGAIPVDKDGYSVRPDAVDPFKVTIQTANSDEDVEA